MASVFVSSWEQGSPGLGDVSEQKAKDFYTSDQICIVSSGAEYRLVKMYLPTRATLAPGRRRTGAVSLKGLSAKSSLGRVDGLLHVAGRPKSQSA
jgi:hypothetical protein